MPAPRRVLVLWLPVAIWLGVILAFSTDAASARQTSRLLGPLLAWLFPQWDEPARATAHFLIRKTAHVTEYAILSALLLRALRGASGVPRANWNGRLALGTVAGCAVVACLDEFLQSLSHARTGTPRDVVFDVAGASLALLLAWCLNRRRAGKPAAPP